MDTPHSGPPTEPMYPAESMHASPMVSQTPTAPAKHYSSLIPWIEFIAGCFGFHGVGLLMVGKRGSGGIWLGLSIAKHLIDAPIIAFTLGFALICLIPLDVAISIYLAINVRRIIHRLEHPALA
jgi:hypothetical protein